MQLSQEIEEFLERLAVFAGIVQKRLSWFLCVAAIASIALAWEAYSISSPWWWNLIKCGAILLPLLVWAVVWSLLSQLQEAPALAAEFAHQPNLSLSGLRSNMADKKPGLISLFSTVRELRSSDNYEIVTDTIGNVTLLANPFMVVVSFAMLVVLFLMIFVAPFVVLF